MAESNAALDDQELTERASIITPSFSSDILQLEHSFGYDCKRLFNLCLIDDDTLVFASGNYLHYFSISRKEVTFRETQFSAGIGFITKNEHPDFEGLLTVAENGARPTIFVYEFPTHNVRVRLEGAAKTQFTCGSYNASGELFASQAGYPDFMLTIWRWQNAEVILRSKSFQSDVLHVHFSNFNPILLVSCGLSHIKFWKMANTFTGLKLQGDLGRFGKTDFSDIYAIYMLPDENVISGCEWGNMLLWEAGLIKFEICRKGRKPCHLKPITRISMRDGEVTTVGMDGVVRIWFWETVDLADPPDDDRFVEIEPIYEFKVRDCEIRGLQKIKPFDETDFGYYAQDGRGGIWYCDLNTNDIPNEPRKLYSCHGGRVIAAQTSPVSTHLMTLGEDGKIFVYDYEARKLLLQKQFISAGTDLLWFSTRVSNTGMEMMVSFEDGVIRQLLLNVRSDRQTAELVLVRALKAHTAAVTKLGINPRESALVTGAADETIFIFLFSEKQNDLIYLRPMGFIKLSAVPNNFNWRAEKNFGILIGCKTGEVIEVDLPARASEEQTFLSYNLTDSDHIRSTKFVSVKSLIRRNLRREQIKKRKEEKRKRKMGEIEKLKAANPGLQIDMETALADSEDDEEEPPLHIPAKPNPILWLRYTTRGTIWVSMAGYDAGYIYELMFGKPEPVQSTIIARGDDCEIHSYLVIKDFLIFGLITGKLRINRINPNDFTDLREFISISMHDGLKGNIPRILLSYDGTHLFSIGHDGNVFSYNWLGPQVVTGASPKSIVHFPQLSVAIEDIDDPAYPSLEQEKIFAEIKRKEKAAAEHDRKVLTEIAQLESKFTTIMRKNNDLPEDLQVTHRDTLLDERITSQIAEELQAELDDVREDLAYDLEVAELGKTKLYNYFLEQLFYIPITIKGVGEEIEVSTLRLDRLGELYEQMRADIDERLKMEAARRGLEDFGETSDMPEPTEPTFAEEKSDSMPEPGIETFFFGRDPNTILPRFNKKMLRLLTRYRNRQLYDIERIYNWDKLERQKPDPNKNHPDDDEGIREAKRTLGDYKLKIGADYEPKPAENFTHKYIEIADCYEHNFRVQAAFNEKLFDLRNEKKKLYEFIAKMRKRVDFINTLLPEGNRSYLPDVPEIQIDYEYPELNLIEHCKPGCGIEIADILYLEKRVKDLLPPPPEKKPAEDLTLLERQEVIKYTDLRVQKVDHVPDDLLVEVKDLPPLTDSAYFESAGDSDSPWLIETRLIWLVNLMNEQQGIIAVVKNRIALFDESIKTVAADRLFARFNSEFISSYLTSINQELVILRDSEQIENQLLNNADEAMGTRNQMQKTINVAMRQIDECRKMCDRLNEQINSIQLKFMTTVKGHKFFDFLRRIFKKKWRPLKPPKDNDESSESSSSDESSSEDEEEDAKSVDSTDMTAIRLDETTCPAGLERPMYDLAFKLRADRHALERALMEQQKIIESRRADVMEQQKQMKYHEEVYAREKATLQEFRHKRQQELNKVKVAVVLRMSQVQHFYPGEDYRDLSRAVLFDSARLVALKGRVDKLRLETLETRRVFRVNIVHLRRMNADIKFMRYEITRLEEEIKDAMTKKFGFVINLNELEEEVLRKYVFELETTAEEELKLIEAEMRKAMRELAAMQDELIHETQENTNKLNVLSVLQEENNFLDKILFAQDKGFEETSKPTSLNLDHDIEKLLAIDHQQKEQIKCLEREICTLRLKAKPLQLDTEVPKVAPDDATRKMDECPDMLAAIAYDLRLMPDDLIMDRIHKLVLKYFGRNLGKHTTKDNIRKYAHKVARYFGQAAYSFQGEITGRILDCITDNLQNLMPKKYLMHLSSDELHKLFQEVLGLLDYERSEVNTEDLISGICDNAVTAVEELPEILNKSQYIFETIFKQLIEVLPPEEFSSESVFEILVSTLHTMGVVDPRCISVKNLIDVVIDYARENLLDGVSAVPVRRLVEQIIKKLLLQKHLVQEPHTNLFLD